MPRGGAFVLAPYARLAFLVAFFGLELAVILRAQGTPDHVLGFQMFNESSRLTIHLFREVQRKHRRVLEPLPDGRWRAPDSRGKLRAYAWQDRVRSYPLWVLETSMHASYGLQAQLFHLQAALEDVAAHLPEDRTTLALVAKVDTLKNGVSGPQLELRAEKR